jgi:sigma-E factor negative regulatory protein RseA
MSERIDEQISEFIDDEMSAEGCEFFVRRLGRDADARSRYLRYQLIGAAMRGELLLTNAASRAYPASPVVAQDDRAVRARAPAWLTGGRAAVGAGIAASVALVAVAGLRLANFTPDDPLPAGTLATEAPSYVVPPPAFDAQSLVPLQGEVTGIQYLIHHTRYSSGLNSTIMRSSVVAGPDTSGVDFSEVTD